MVRLQTDEIHAAELIESVRSRADGAVSLFLGTVREHNRGRRVLYLEYQAYEPMALSEMARIEDQVRARFGAERIALVHRLGRLELGEVSVGIAVAAAHRAAAFDACRFAIETLKRTVPIWKREFFEGGQVWIEGQP